MAVLPCDYYVRPTNGNDSNDGLSFANAFKSLQKALDTVTATAGQIKIVGLVCEADEIITDRIDDDTNMIPAAAAVNFLSLNADGSYETNPTLRPTYWISANGVAITNTDMFQAAVAGNNNKYFENIGFKNCLRDSVILSTGVFGMSFGVLSCKNIGRYGLVCATTGTNNYIDFLFVDGCVQAVSGTTTGVIHIKRCFVLNASGVALQSGSTFTYGEIYLSSCANGLRITAKLKVDRIYADSVAGYVFALAGTNISNVVDIVRAINCGSIFKPEAAGNMITCRMLYKYNVTNDTDPTALGVTNIVNQVTMSSSGKAGVAGDGNLTLLESAEYRRIAIPLDANNTYYQETGLPGPNLIYPRIIQSNPSYGSTDGTTITLNGAGLSGCTSLLFGSTSGTIVSSGDTFISGVVPSLSAGRYDITVSGANGIAGISGGWTSVATERKITSLSQTTGDQNTYITIDIESEEGLFSNASGVYFGETPVISFKVISPYLIKAVVPTITPDLYRVEVV